MERLTADHPEIRGLDPIEANRMQLRDLFPEAFTEGKVDFDVLRQLLGDDVDAGEERYGMNWYGMNWHGKRAARQLALTPSVGTLRPCPEESVNWDTTRNLMIEGDNLEVLKLLQKSYYGKVKLIYIDPPYNTGNDYIYPDDYHDSIGRYKAITGQIDGNGHKVSSNGDSSGRFHTKWLNMMYPRLRVARDLLRRDGVIMISIDDHEIHNLKSMCCEIFGEENFLSVLIWNKQHSQQQGLIKRYHEYVMLFAKDAEMVKTIGGGQGHIDAGALKRISRGNPASDFTFPAGTRFDAPDGFELTGQFGDAERVEVVSGRFMCKDGRTMEEVTLRAGWTQRKQMESYFAGNETYDSREQKIIEFYFSSTGKLKCLKERVRITPSSLLQKYGMVSEQTSRLSKLMGAPVFPTPKPVEMMKEFIGWFTNEGDITMDFFAGSGTLAEAVYRTACDNATPKRFILVQLPQPVASDNPNEAAAANYCYRLGKSRNLAELTKERLRRSSKSAEEEPCNDNGDLGFRVFKLDTTNIRAWEPDPDSMLESLDDAVEHLKANRSEDDILYEIVLRLGLDLASRIETREIAGKRVHVVGDGELVVCLAAAIGHGEVDPLVLGIVQWRKEFAAEETMLVFRDSAFADDVAKTNVNEILKQSGFSNVRSI